MPTKYEKDLRDKNPLNEFITLDSVQAWKHNEVTRFFLRDIEISKQEFKDRRRMNINSIDQTALQTAYLEGCEDGVSEFQNNIESIEEELKRK